MQHVAELLYQYLIKGQSVSIFRTFSSITCRPATKELPSSHLLNEIRYLLHVPLAAVTRIIDLKIPRGSPRAPRRLQNTLIFPRNYITPAAEHLSRARSSIGDETRSATSKSSASLQINATRDAIRSAHNSLSRGGIRNRGALAAQRAQPITLDPAGNTCGPRDIPRDRSRTV